MSIASRFDQFVAYLRPPLSRIEKANRQGTYLIEQLKKWGTKDHTYVVEGVFWAGSNAKHTALRSTKDHPFDVDIGVYFREGDPTDDHFRLLMDSICVQLIKIYPGKPDEDFKRDGSAIRVCFRKNRLHMDIVPVIRDSTLHLKHGGWIPRHDGKRLTSIVCHVDVVRKRTAKSKQHRQTPFNKVVRLVKWWNERQGELKQSSYFCELITAAAFDAGAFTGQWQRTLCGVFSFLLKHQLRQPIFFDDYLERAHPPAFPANPVVILDAVNPENNITRKWDEGMRCGYMKCVQRTYDQMLLACRYEREGNEQEAVNVWCQIFGRAFRSCGGQFPRN